MKKIIASGMAALALSVAAPLLAASSASRGVCPLPPMKAPPPGCTYLCNAKDKNGCTICKQSCPVSSAQPGKTSPCQTLNGSFKGDFTVPPVVPDAGKTYNVTGKATFASPGAMDGKGAFHSTGLIKKGNATGDLTFSTKKGSMVLHLQGESQAAFAMLPPSFVYSIKKATGAYGKMTGQGTASLSLVSSGNSGSFTLTFRGTCR